jgi:rare lipoprotein A (peptidoglycan hydrolase)
MITRTLMTFPGVIVSLMLAVPALAGAPPAEPANQARQAPQRPQAARKRTARVHIDAEVQQPGAQSGIASWYGGKRWQGKMTASGIRYDEAALTAAHATLPIGSKVRVVVTDTGRSVIVTINDRPGTRTRVIDLSRGAAAELGILQRGVARVTLLPT